MARSYAAVDLVQLPRLDAQGAITLGAEIGAAAKAIKAAKAKLSKPLSAALKNTLSTQAALVKAAAAVPARSGVDPELVRLADQGVDGGWSALASFLDGWSRLPDLKKPGAKAPQAEVAKELHTALFDDGLKFLVLSFRAEWAESETRLKRIHDQKLAPKIEALGGKLFLETIRACHARYGQLLGITKVGAEAPPPQVKSSEALVAFTDSLRRLVIQASAFADEDEGNAKIASRLLAPLQDWEDTAPTKAPAAPPPAAPPATKPA